MINNGGPEKVRVDKWLWAARFFKTRADAARAVAGGKVHVNGARVKPAKAIGVGDELRIRKSHFEFTLVVCGVSARRRQATEARQLYEESEASQQRRAELTARRCEERSFGARVPQRPDKRGRRELLRFKKGG